MTIDLSTETETKEDQKKENSKEQPEIRKNIQQSIKQEVYQMEQENKEDIYQDEQSENKRRGGYGYHSAWPIIGALAAVWAVLVVLGIGRINMYLMMNEHMTAYGEEKETVQEAVLASPTEEVELRDEQMQDVMLSVEVEETVQQNETLPDADASLQTDGTEQQEVVLQDEITPVVEDEYEPQQQEEQAQDNDSMFDDKTVGTEYWMYIGLNDRDTYQQEITTDDAKALISSICASHVDGYTMFEASGGWVDELGVLTEELTLVCVFREATEEQMQAIMEEILVDFNQNAVLLERRVSDASFYNRNE